ncbi:MAG TPA: ergothioneine biosynthesis protein EgtC [Alphaproteobacteria bacterium]|nr:ergothioneine biosynthesis protein EgtC [Alphaproteobacteria bacterium]
MCRLLAYLGPPVRLDRLITEPAHSLVVQSYKPREMTSGHVNADGFGFGWYDRTERAEPYVYRSVLPIWNDDNLADLCAFVRADCVMANVRSATPGQLLAAANTQPFVSGALSVLHNGFVTDFKATLQRPIRKALDDESYAAISGTTDSEHLFAWLLQHLRGAADLRAGLGAGLASLMALAPRAEMTLNFIVSDGEQLVASRLAHNVATPSLYSLADPRQFPGAVLIASEPLFDDPAWTPIPEGSLISIDRTRTITVDALAA